MKKFNWHIVKFNDQYAIRKIVFANWFDARLFKFIFLDKDTNSTYDDISDVHQYCLFHTILTAKNRLSSYEFLQSRKMNYQKPIIKMI